MDENGDFPSFFVCLPGRVTTMTVWGSHGDVMRCTPWTAKVKRLDRSRSCQAGFRRGQVPWGPWPSRKVMKTGDFPCVSCWWFGTAILNLHLWLGFSMAMLNNQRLQIASNFQGTPGTPMAKLCRLAPKSPSGSNTESSPRPVLPRWDCTIWGISKTTNYPEYQF
jgi:hypothetical protein